MKKRKQKPLVIAAEDPKEDLVLVAQLKEDPRWEALVRCLGRYNRAVAFSSYRLDMSIEKHRYAHAAYGGQGEALKYLVKFVDFASKKLKEKEKKEDNNGPTETTNKY